MKVLTKLIVKHSNSFIKKIWVKTIYRQIRKYNSFPPPHTPKDRTSKVLSFGFGVPPRSVGWGWVT